VPIPLSAANYARLVQVVKTRREGMKQAIVAGEPADPGAVTDKAIEDEGWRRNPPE
jgi:hypothetical protein